MPSKEGIRDALKALDHIAATADMHSLSHAFTKLIQSCGKMKSLEDAKLLHMHALKHGCAGDVSVATSLISMYGKCGSLARSRQIFDRMQKRTVVPWNAMISGYARHANYSEEALKLGQQLKHQGIPPTRVTYLCLLNACSNLGALGKGKALHQEVIAAGLESDPFIRSALVGMYAKGGDLLHARHIFERIVERNVVTWNALIAAYMRHGKSMEVLKLCERMRHEGVELDRVTYILLLGAHGNLRDLEGGKRIQSLIVSHGCESDVFVGTALIDMYAKCGSLTDAWKVFNKMPTRNIVSWTAMITGHVKQNCPRDALKLYKGMKEGGLKPNEVTFVSVLNACASLAALEEGHQVHTEIVEAGLESQLCVDNALIDMYGKCGSLWHANQVFCRMPKRDVISWTAIISACSMHGQFAKAFEYFKRMLAEHVRPNAVTFSSVLCVCSHLGLVEEGLNLFKQMSQEYGIAPSSEHYNCMVDLLARAGCLEEADEFVQRMPKFP